MKSVIWLLACLALVGCGSRPWDTRTVDSSGDVSSELATAVRRALEAKRAEEDRLVQYGVEKRRLVSRLMPIDTTVDWTDVPAIEDFVSGRDARLRRTCVWSWSGTPWTASGVWERRLPWGGIGWRLVGCIGSRGRRRRTRKNRAWSCSWRSSISRIWSPPEPPFAKDRRPELEAGIGRAGGSRAGTRGGCVACRGP